LAKGKLIRQKDVDHIIYGHACVDVKFVGYLAWLLPSQTSYWNFCWIFPMMEKLVGMAIGSH